MACSSLFIALLLSVASGATGLATDGWLVDMDAARAQAEQEGKDLLIDFTGSDWCFWCKKLDGEVFQEGLFREGAVGDFVLLMLDYPNDKSGQSEETQEQNERLKAEYGVTGFPTVILADAFGRPYAKTGYKQGGAQVYLDHLEELQKVRSRFQDALVRAEDTTGLIRARRLDAALAILPSGYLSSFYSAFMSEIVDADPDDKAGLGSKYRELLDSSTRKLALQRIAASVDTHEETLNWSGLIADMDEVLREHGRIPLAAQRALMHKGRALLELGELESGLAALVAARGQSDEGEFVATLERMIEDVREELGG